MVRGVRWMDNHSDTVLYIGADNNNNEVDSSITVPLYNRQTVRLLYYGVIVRPASNDHRTQNLVLAIIIIIMGDFSSACSLKMNNVTQSQKER